MKPDANEMQRRYCKQTNVYIRRSWLGEHIHGYYRCSSWNFTSENLLRMLRLFCFLMIAHFSMVEALHEDLCNDEYIGDHRTVTGSLKVACPLSKCLCLPSPITNQSAVHAAQYTSPIIDVACANQDLSFVPSFPSMTDIRLLNLSGNTLTQLTNSSFRYVTTLQTLDLSHNQIRTIGSAALRGLKTLTHLYLDHNELHHLNSDIFLHLNRLHHLDLSHNFLSELQMGLFQRGQKLSSLVLHHNTLLSLPLMPLKELNLLDISHNPNITITSKQMSLLPGLMNLNLSYTGLSDPEIVCDFLSLDVFPQLLQLDLSSNKFTFLNKGHLDILHSKVDVLDLSGNPFHCDCSVLDMVDWLKSHIKPSAPNKDSNKWILPKCHLPGFLTTINVGDLSIDRLKYSCDLVTECGVNSKTQLCKTINNLRRSLHKVLPEMYSSTKIPRIEYSSIKLPYDPKLGWWTAASLGCMMVSIILCLLLEVAKKKCEEYRHRRWRRNCRKAWEAAKTRSGTQNELVFPLQYQTPVYYSKEITLDTVTKATKLELKNTSYTNIVNVAGSRTIESGLSFNNLNTAGRHGHEIFSPQAGN